MLDTLPAKRWDYAAAAHLLNRAGFGGTPVEIDSLHARGHAGAVAYLVNFEKLPDNTPNPDWAKPDSERLERYKKIRDADPQARQQMVKDEQQKQRRNIVLLKYWWMERMASGPRPLQEKMTLFWHGHFATSMEKVRDAYLMFRQNDLFRKEGTGNWLRLLTATAQDPAMLIWLDQAQSRREHPNENFAREVMELFTLGEGHYTEKDVTEAARALTGWTFNRLDQEFENRERLHDEGTKTVLGRTGNLNGDDVLAQIVAQPQAARFICAKIWNFFAGVEPSEETLAKLAEGFRTSGNDFKPLLAAIFRSEVFYSDSIVRNQVKSPVQWLVGSVRMLERDLPGPLICFGLTRNLGQDLFLPPNVKGWDGGLSWITTNNLLARYNEAAILAQGDTALLKTTMAGAAGGLGQDATMRLQNLTQNLRLKTVDVEKILTTAERADKNKLLASLEKRLLQSKLSGKQEKTLRDYLDSQDLMDDNAIRNAIRLMMSTPEYQLT